MTQRILICGSRTWEDALAVRRLIQSLPNGSVVIHGAARGADTVADREAKACGFAVEAYPADWKTHGKSAGPIRNREMLALGKPDRVVAFRSNGESRGTDNMIAQARAAGIPVEIVSPEGVTR